MSKLQPSSIVRPRRRLAYPIEDQVSRCPICSGPLSADIVRGRQMWRCHCTKVDVGEVVMNGKGGKS